MSHTLLRQQGFFTFALLLASRHICKSGDEVSGILRRAGLRAAPAQSMQARLVGGRLATVMLCARGLHSSSFKLSSCDTPGLLQDRHSVWRRTAEDSANTSTDGATALQSCPCRQQAAACLHAADASASRLNPDPSLLRLRSLSHCLQRQKLNLISEPREPRPLMVQSPAIHFVDKHPAVLAHAPIPASVV